MTIPPVWGFLVLSGYKFSLVLRPWMHQAPAGKSEPGHILGKWLTSA